VVTPKPAELVRLLAKAEMVEMRGLVMAAFALSACDQSSSNNAMSKRALKQTTFSKRSAQEVRIGWAYMDSRRVITLRLYFDEMLNGKHIIGDGTFVHKPGDEEYNEVLEHLGPIHPGESVAVYPFPEPKRP
jgi:hypothetical protein